VKKETAIPSAKELKKLAKAARKRMVELFHERKSLADLKPYLSVGLARIDQKRDIAVLLSKFLLKRGIRNVETLADFLYIGEDHLEALEWMTFPVAFQERSSKRNHDCYLLALCNIERDPRSRRYRPTPITTA